MSSKEVVLYAPSPNVTNNDELNSEPKEEPFSLPGGPITCVVDTCSLLDYPAMLQIRRSNLQLVVPIAVVEELDKFQHSTGSLRDKARRLTRILSGLELHGHIVLQQIGQWTSFGSTNPSVILTSALFDSADNQILDCALCIHRETGTPPILVTEDRLLQIKAKTNGLCSLSAINIVYGRTTNEEETRHQAQEKRKRQKKRKREAIREDETGPSHKRHKPNTSTIREDETGPSHKRHKPNTSTSDTDAVDVVVPIILALAWGCALLSGLI